MKWFLETPNDVALTVARLFLGGVLWIHGAQLVLGWFGGQGFSETVRTFTGPGMALPAPLALIAILTLFLAPLGLIAGALTRPAALGLAIFMAVAATKHLGNGFFMNWFGGQRGEGFEFHLLAVGAALTLAIRGAGAFSFDRWLAIRTPVASVRPVLA